MSKTDAAVAPKGRWTKPVVRRLRAGAAEVSTNTIQDDADPQGIKNNS